MKNQDMAILKAMQTYGGSFAKNIAAAAMTADSTNYSKLKAAFPELWERYAEFVKLNLVG